MITPVLQDMSNLNRRTLAMLTTTSALQGRGRHHQLQAGDHAGQLQPRRRSGQLRHYGGGALDLSVRDPSRSRLSTAHIFHSRCRHRELPDLQRGCEIPTRCIPAHPSTFTQLPLGIWNSPKQHKNKLTEPSATSEVTMDCPATMVSPRGTHTSGEMVVCGWMTDLGYATWELMKTA